METKYESIKRKEKVEEQNFIDFAQAKGIKKFKFTPTICPYDVKMLSGNTYCIVEVKSRQDKDMAFFERYGPFLELKKIQGMYDEQQRILSNTGIETQMMYFNYASDGVQIFYLQEPWNYNFTWRYLPRDNYNVNIKEWKMVADLEYPTEILKKIN